MNSPPSQKYVIIGPATEHNPALHINPLMWIST